MSGTMEQRGATVPVGGGVGMTAGVAATAVTTALARLVAAAVPEVIRAAKVRFFVLFFLFFVRFDKPRSPRVTVYLLQMSQPLCSIDPLEYNTGPLAQGRFIT